MFLIRTQENDSRRDTKSLRLDNFTSMKCCDEIGVGNSGQRLSGSAEGSQAPGMGERPLRASYRLQGALVHCERADAAWKDKYSEAGSGRAAACERSGTSSPSA